MKIVIDEKAVQEIKGSDCITGLLFGREIQEENLIQIVSFKTTLKHNFWHEVGRWYKEAVTNKGVELLVNGNGLKCFIDGKEISQVEVFNMQDYNARNRSEILSQKVKAKKAFLVSCGSVNSRVGYELAKHGIEIAITDPDYLDIANPYRWGIQQMPELLAGRLKTIAFKDAVMSNIPNAEVKAFAYDFCKDITFFDKFTDEWKPALMVIATDTEDSRRDVNWLSYNKGIPALYIGLADKAESGQIIYISGKKQDPCYMCFKGNSGNEGGPINLRSTNKQYGVDENEQRSVPALSIDVNIISDIATKLAMVILAGEDISQYFKQFDNKGDALWFSTKPDTWVFEDFAQKLVAKIEKNPDCVICGRI
ncbi:MAG: ThiF family adenylyltransferase [Candidatus Kaelpia imicola]|nr:ThiF family adenylyltransferase [Candidatus Kaelpia imicola]